MEFVGPDAVLSRETGGLGASSTSDSAARPGRAPPAPVLGYVVQQFPSLRTTFVRREVEALRRAGLPLRVVSLRSPDAAEIRTEAEALPHVEATTYLPYGPLSPRAFFDNAAALRRRPRAWLRNWFDLALGAPGARGAARRLRMLLQVWRGATVARLLRDLGRCAHVHAQFADGAASTGLAAARLLGATFSWTSHTSFDSPALLPKLRDASFVASISRYDARRLARFAGRSHTPDIRVIHCGLDPTAWPFRAPPPVASPPRVLSVGALIEKKGHDVLVRACARLAHEGFPVRCDVVGAGPLAPSLEALVRSEGAGEVVRLLGPKPQAEVRALLAQADVFALACRRAGNGDLDGLPVSLIEAMAVGVPVVTTDFSGIPDLVRDRVTGLLAAPGDDVAFARALRAALDGSVDRARMAAEARRWVEQEFDVRRECGRLAALLADRLAAADAAR
jgi:glycosyltransferase involved in cell wall biosynthesis